MKEKPRSNTMSIAGFVGRDVEGGRGLEEMGLKTGAGIAMEIVEAKDREKRTCDEETSMSVYSKIEDSALLTDSSKFQSYRIKNEGKRPPSL